MDDPSEPSEVIELRDASTELIKASKSSQDNRKKQKETGAVKGARSHLRVNVSTARNDAPS
jgi:hypothetical protein